MTLFERLDRYWFEPARVRDLSCLRIAVVFVLLADTLWPGNLDHHLLLARLPNGWFVAIPALKVLMLPFGWGARPSAMLIVGMWIVCGVAGISALIGAYTRWSLAIFAAANTLLLAHFYSYGTMRHPEAAATIVLWLLVLTPSGDELSVDSLRAGVDESRRRERFVPREIEAMSRDARWPLRLAQWLLVCVYLSAVLSKLTVGGAAWLNGYTMSYYLLFDGFGHAAPLSVALAHVHWIGVAAAATTLAFELTFVVCVLYPRTAPAYLAIGSTLHTGIWILMRAPFFQLLALYVAFAEPLREQRKWGVEKVRRGKHETPVRVWTLVYDGYCPLCIRTMTQLDALDGARRLRYVDLERQSALAKALLPGVSPEEMREEMVVVTPAECALRGFYAFREISRRLPALWPLVPLMFVPGSAWVGTRLYAWVAANRARRLCEGDACAVHGSHGAATSARGVGAVIDFGGSAS
ncbi:MAG: DCC1-like thiol-disulfide oxidoreductase family protein [Gemmatimonadota bacterium]